MTAAYIASVATAVTLALFLRAPINKFISSFSRQGLVLSNAFVSTVSLSAASFINSGVMHSKELKEGARVFDEEG